MDASILFKLLYVAVPIIGIGAYIPQIIGLYLQKTCAVSFTLSTWYLWIFASAVCVGYGAFSLQDFMFTLTSVLHLAAQILIVGLVLYRRHKDSVEAAYEGFLGAMRRAFVPQQVAFVSVLLLIF